MDELVRPTCENKALRGYRVVQPADRLVRDVVPQRAFPPVADVEEGNVRADRQPDFVRRIRKSAARTDDRAAADQKAQFRSGARQDERLPGEGGHDAGRRAGERSDPGILPKLLDRGRVQRLLPAFVGDPAEPSFVFVQRRSDLPFGVAVRHYLLMEFG